jgi:hypothetical protein
VHLDIGDLEPGVSDASSGGEPACFGYLDPGQVRAESAPAAGGACREDGRIAAAAPDVENVLPVLDLRGNQQPRRQPAPHSLMPLTLLDEVPSAGSVPVLGLLRIHRHEGHVTSARTRPRASNPGKTPRRGRGDDPALVSPFPSLTSADRIQDTGEMVDRRGELLMEDEEIR